MTTANSPLFFADELPADALAATRRFEDRYLMSIGAVPPPTWADKGDLIPTEAPLVTFPVSAFAQQYQRFTGEARFKTLENKSFDVKPEPFQAGHEADLLEITKVPWKYRQWLQGTERFMLAEGLLRCKSLAALLIAGQSTLWGSGAGLDGANFFDTTHLADITDESSKTWSNYQSTTKSVIDITDLQGEVTAMQANVLDENGEVVDSDPDTIMVSPKQFEPVRNFISKEYILDPGGAAATNNPFYKRFDVVKNPQLPSSGAGSLDWYLMDMKLIGRTGLPPWLSLRMTVPQNLGLTFFDESSDYFKTTGKIRASSKVWYGFALAFPHGIRKILGK